MKAKTFIFLLVFCVVVWIIFTFKITEVPPGINGDEAAIGYNATLISDTLKDENGRTLPLFISTLDGKDWKQSVTMYTTALAFRVFGPSYELFRSVSVVFVLVSSVLLFFLLQEVWGFKVAVVGLLLFITTPIIMIQSHLALENIAPVPFVIAWLLMMAKYYKTGKNKFLIFAGIFLGSSLFAYQAMRLIAPIFAGLSLMYVFYLYTEQKKKTLKPFFYFILGMVPFIFFLVLAWKIYPGALAAYNRPSLNVPYQALLLPYLSSFDLSFLFVTGDITAYHSTGKHGIYLLATLPLFLLGCYKSFQTKNPFLIFVAATFFLAPLFYGLVGSVHRGSRLLPQIPAYIVLASFGVKVLMGLKGKLLKFGIGGLLVFLVVINYYDFINDYWFAYPGRAKNYFPSTLHLASKNLSEQAKILNKSPIMQGDIYRREKMAAKFFERIYFSPAVEIWDLGVPTINEGIVLVRSSDAQKLIDHGFRQLKSETPDYSLFVK